MRSETKGSQFEYGCYLCAEMSGNGSEELKKCPPSSPTVLWFVNGRERKRRKKEKKYVYEGF